MTELAPGAAPTPGWVADELRAEFPELRLHALVVEAVPGRSTRALKQRLKELSSRFRGAHAVAMRQSPVPWAYRVFYRHIGLDPDTTRTPPEAAAVQRLLDGGFKPRNHLDDALTVAVVETGVPVWALDADRVAGPLGVRVAADGERLGGEPVGPELPTGRIVVADDRRALAVLFGELAPGRGVGPATTRMMLFTVQVAGVPAIHVEEALWSCATLLGEI